MLEQVFFLFPSLRLTPHHCISKWQQVLNYKSTNTTVTDSKSRSVGCLTFNDDILSLLSLTTRGSRLGTDDANRTGATPSCLLIRPLVSILSRKVLQLNWIWITRAFGGKICFKNLYLKTTYTLCMYVDVDFMKFVAIWFVTVYHYLVSYHRLWWDFFVANQILNVKVQKRCLVIILCNCLKWKYLLSQSLACSSLLKPFQ